MLNSWPAGWAMGFGDTVVAAFTAPHAIECYAERIVLFLAFTGDVGAILAGLSAVAAFKLSAHKA